jgi:predicted transcriptional regulator
VKINEKQLARKLRKQGWSINDIYKKLGVAKSSVSLWVRDIELTDDQRQELSIKGHLKQTVEKRRETRLANENKRRQVIIDQGVSEIPALSQTDLFLIGVALYWAEGRKTTNGILSISNGDPILIKVAMRFFRLICKAPEHKLRAHIHIHPHLDHNKAECYWSKITGIPLNQFIKTYRKPNKSSQNKKDSLPYGTLSVYVCDTTMVLKMKGWIEGLGINLLNENSLDFNKEIKQNSSTPR